MTTNNPFAWTVIGAGPAGIAAVGLLIDHGVKPQEILWVDRYFGAGDLGRYWKNVSSNTSVKLFLQFLNGIKAFKYENHPQPFELDKLDVNQTTVLNNIVQPLKWVTEQLSKHVKTQKGLVTRLFANDGFWNLEIGKQVFQTQKIILATGASPKSLNYSQLEEIKLTTALDPEKLNNSVKPDDSVAVFGSSHSAMIIIRNLLEFGVKKVVNFYLTPIRYALQMDGWILYDDTGLKGETAEWVRHNLSKRTHPKVERYIANDSNIENYLCLCNKVIYAIGFTQHLPLAANIDFRQYDTTNGIIAPGLFGAGIGFPKKFIDPNGNVELSVGLFKFMRDLKIMLPIWLRYGL